MALGQYDMAHIFLCRSGHHRSVAFVELLYMFLRDRHPKAYVLTWHLDHVSSEPSWDRNVWNFKHFWKLDKQSQHDTLGKALTNADASCRLEGLPRLHDINWEANAL